MTNIIHKVNDYEIFSKIIDISELGRTYKARNTVTNQSVLIVVLESATVLKESSKNSIDFITELQTFQKILGENILPIIEIMQTENHFYVVIECPEEMNLQSLIDSKGPFPEDKLLGLFCDILIGYLPYLKGNKLHRNILSKNIYKSSNRYKLMNFPYTQSLKTKAVSTLFYYKNGCPPYEVLESYLNSKFDQKVDVWSMGVVFYEAAFGIVPFTGNDKEKLLENLENLIKNRKSFLGDLPNPKGVNVKADLKDLLEKMLQFEPKDRIDFVQILSHPYFQKKKQDYLFYICDYFKQMKYDIEHDLNAFKTMDVTLVASLQKCFKFCSLDPLKLNELDMLETLQKIPNEFGSSCDFVYRIQFLEEYCQDATSIPKKPPHSLGDFPYQTRAVSQKALPCGSKLDDEDEDDINMESMDSKEFSKPSKNKNPIPIKKITKNEKIIEKVDAKLLEMKNAFRENLQHEMDILRFLEDILSCINQVVGSKENVCSLMSFILAKYLFIRVEWIKLCLIKKENMFYLDNWKTQVLYLNMDNQIDYLKKLSSKISQGMNLNFENIKISDVKDKKLISFINFNVDITSQDEKIYVRQFLKIILDFKDLMEKNNQKMLSKYGYGVILKLLYFLQIYEKFGFFKFDNNNEIDVMKMTQNVNEMDKEKMKKEIVEFLKTFLQNI